MIVYEHLYTRTVTQCAANITVIIRMTDITAASVEVVTPLFGDNTCNSKRLEDVTDADDDCYRQDSVIKRCKFYYISTERVASFTCKYKDNIKSIA